MKTNYQPASLIVDPLLLLKAGHAYHSALAVKKLAEDEGLNPYVLMSTLASDAQLPKDRWIPAFSTNCFNRKDWTALGFEAHRTHYREIIEKFVKKLSLHIVCVIMPTADQALVAALADLIVKKVLPNDCSIIGWFLLPPAWAGENRSSPSDEQVKEYLLSFNLLQSKMDKSNLLHFFCETNALSSQYSDLLKLSIGTLPCPNALDIELPEAGVDKSFSNEFHFLMTGHATINKGYELLAEAIHQVAKERSDIRFTIHAVAKYSGNNDIKYIIRKIENTEKKVGVICTELSTYDYYKLMTSADIVMLPYNMTGYGSRGSGVYNEASRLGIPVIVPSNAEFAKLAIAQGRAVEMASYTAGALASAIKCAAQNMEELKFQAKSHAEDEDKNRAACYEIAMHLNRIGQAHVRGVQGESFVSRYKNAVTYLQKFISNAWKAND